MNGVLVAPTSEYTDEQRRQACIELHTIGNIQRVSDSIGIPRRTLNDWMHTEWFAELSAEVRQQVGESILTKNLAIAQAAQDTVLDRLENGDTKLKTIKGKVTRHKIPMTGKDCAVVGGIYQDKARVQMGMATSITKSESMLDLAKKFQELSEQVEKDRSVVSEQ